MISIENLNKYYGRQHVLKDINLNLDAGQCVAFVGPNGCGKTTLMKSILGLVKPQSGTILVNGKDIAADPTYREHIGFMPQNSDFPENMSGRQIFRTIMQVRGYKGQLDRELYEAFRIEDIADKPTRALSGGTSQKMNAALAFLFNPDILILDEPTASLDPLAADTLKQKIRQEKDKLVFVTSHILSELNDIATHVVFMDEGRILFFKSVEQLTSETGEKDVNDAVTSVLKRTNEHKATLA